MNPTQIEQAAREIWRHWRDGKRMVALPAPLRPAGREEGYAIQAWLEQQSQGPLFGWKIAATSAAGQAHIGVNGPLAGRLLAERAHPDGAQLDFGANHMAVAEPEFAFRFARDLPPREDSYDLAEVIEAVETLHPAIEVPDSRYHDFATAGAAQLLADNACAHQFVLGPAAPESWREADLAQHPVRIEVPGGAAQEGRGANVLGDPRAALAWLVNELSGLGITLRAGQTVTTGTCATPLPVAAGDAVTADFGALGRVSLRFGAA